MLVLVLVEHGEIQALRAGRAIAPHGQRLSGRLGSWDILVQAGKGASLPRQTKLAVIGIASAAEGGRCYLGTSRVAARRYL